MRAIERRYWAVATALLAAGLLVRLVVAKTTDGIAFDLESWRLTHAALHAHGLDVYAHIHPSRFPYPPGYLPWIAVAGDLSKAVRLPPMLADIGIALLVQDLLRRAGEPPWRRLAAVALVALGPIFVGVAGFNGQLDPVAILPALAAYWVWTRPGQTRRALLAGALIGVAASIKTVPALMVLALAPSARSWREAAALAAAALGTFALVFAPLVAATPGEALRVFSYHGVPGFGGISLLVQPSFPHEVLAGRPVHATAALEFMRDHGHQAILLPALAALAALLARRRPDALTSTVLVWLTVYVLGVNFFLQYLVWGLPFLLARGHLRAVAAVQLALTPAMLLVYNAPVDERAALLGYTVPIVATWLVAAAALGVMTRDLRHSSSPKVV